MKLATAERKTHRSDVDTGGYTALDFTLHNSHVLNANIFTWPLGRVGICRVLLYNLYSGADAVRTKHNNNNNITYIANMLLVYVGLAQARPN